MLRGPLEKDTCRDVILPALASAGWTEDQIRPEFVVRPRRVLTAGGVERELRDGRVDYVLEVVPGLPVAVVEAKRGYRQASDGMQQAVRYAEQLDVPVAYASNGDVVLERYLPAGSERAVDTFATPIELWNRYVEWRGLSEHADLLRQPFNRLRRTAAGDVLAPRWYQTVAIHRVLSAMARGHRRLLLLMATGTGKTFTAMQIVHKLRQFERLVRPEHNYRVLYLADRNALVSQPQDKDFATAFGAGPLHRVSGRATRSREIYFATYQALAGGGDEAELFQHYPPDFFDLVIVDECHRGSATENSSWRNILDHFASAVQLGLTATPKQDDTVDTYAYFGDPVFSYSLRQGIEDGYLAPYRVRRVVLSPDADGWQPDPGELDRFGREVPEGRYSTRDFERVVRLLMRTDLAARYLSQLLRRRPTARTLIFCVDVQHADEMRRAMIDANPDLVAGDPEWVVRIVGTEGERVRLLANFCNPDSVTPTVVTTSRLLSTGVDIEDLEYVVLFRPIGSPVEFKQIIGRGTRLYPEKGKTSFEIIDFVGATSHFADPDFDGYPTRIVTDHEDSTESEAPDEDVDWDEDLSSSSRDAVAEPTPRFVAANPDDQDLGAGSTRPRAPAFAVDTGDFFVVAEAVQVPDTSTGALVLTEYGEFVSGRIRQLAATPADLAERWARQPTRAVVIDVLASSGIDVGDLMPPGEDEVDPLDVLLQIAWNHPARTRAQRAREARESHHSELESRSRVAREVLSALLDRYASHGVDEITSPEALRLPPLSDLGSPRQIDRSLTDSGGLRAVIDEVQDWIYDERFVS